MKHSLSISIFHIAALLSIVTLTGCNDDVFIKPLAVTPDEAVLGPDCRSVRLKVSGADPTGCYLTLTDDSGERYYSEVTDMTTDCLTLRAEAGAGYIDLALDRYVGRADARLDVMVSNDYESAAATVIIKPTESYDLQITDVSYELDMWNGYPDESYTTTFRGIVNPVGNDKDIEFTLPAPDDAPVIYSFSPYGEEDALTRALLSDDIEVPVPSYTRNLGYGFWSIIGETARLTRSQSYFFTRCVPPMPAPVPIPAHTPYAVEVEVAYECFGLTCTISAVNPLTDVIEQVRCILRMYIPVSYNYLVNLK